MKKSGGAGTWSSDMEDRGGEQTCGEERRGEWASIENPRICKVTKGEEERIKQ